MNSQAPHCFDPIDVTQQEDVQQAVEEMLNVANENGLPCDASEELRKIVYDNIDIFGTELSEGAPHRFRRCISSSHLTHNPFE